jgi:hypothetical protein
MIRLPMLNVDPWFAGVRDDDERAALSAAPNAPRLASSAEDVFGAAIAHRQSQRDLIKRSESGSFRNEALERHSQALHIGRCEGRAVRHERDVLTIRLGVSAVNRDQTSMSKLDHRVFADFKRSAGGVNARRPCGTHGRSGAESVDAAEHCMKIPQRDRRVIQSNQGGEM